MKIRRILWLALLLFGSLLLFVQNGQQAARAQQPTVAVATVTGTPPGPMGMVAAGITQVYVHSGPGRDYPVTGILVSGETFPVLGMTIGGEWVQIVYLGVPDGKGWVFGSLVSTSVALPLVTPPPTPTPRSAPVLDSTLAAQFDIQSQPTPLPTFTVPAPLSIPTYPPQGVRSSVERLPMGFLIIGLAVVGLFGTALSLLRGR